MASTFGVVGFGFKEAVVKDERDKPPRVVGNSF